MDQYFIKAPYSSQPKLITKIGNDYIDLKGNDSIEMQPQFKGGPKKEVQVKGATQEVLGKLYEGIETYGNYRKIIGKVGSDADPVSLFSTPAPSNVQAGKPAKD
jgi:hypothetical protein